MKDLDVNPSYLEYPYEHEANRNIFPFSVVQHKFLNNMLIIRQALYLALLHKEVEKIVEFEKVFNLFSDFVNTT